MTKTHEPTDTFDLEAVRREWIGRSSEVVHGRYPVEYDAIRRHCHMVEDLNPLFLDPVYAAGTRFGGVIAPPVMAEYFAINGAWPPSEEAKKLSQFVPSRGARKLNLNQVMEFKKPIRIGDRLCWQQVIVDIKEKSTSLDPKAIWVTSEMRIMNQDGEVVVVITNTGISHREPSEIAADTAGDAS